MIKTFSFAGQPTERVLTVKALQDAKGVRKFTQTTATSVEEAAAAAEAGIEMLIGPVATLPSMREGAPHAFITIGVHMWGFPTADEVLTQAFKVLEAGADAVYCPREPRIVEHLAAAKVPVMGHLGLVPRTSTWTGGIRAVGKTADEAMRLYRDFKDLENAGAVAVEAEVVAADVLAEIAQHTSLSVVSLGSGPGGDVDYLFMEDICGETPERPRHARAFADLLAMKNAVQAKRVEALRAFRDAVTSGSFPQPNETVGVPPSELAAFREKLASGG